MNTRAPVGLLPPQQDVQVLVGRPGVAQMELHGRPHGHDVAHGHRAGPPVGAEDAAQQEVAAAEGLAVLVDDPARSGARPSRAGHLVFGQRTVGLRHQPLQGRRPGQLEDHVALRAGHDQRLTEGPASLGHHRLDPDPGTEERPHRARRSGPGVRMASRFPPGAWAADAIPPMTGRPG